MGECPQGYLGPPPSGRQDRCHGCSNVPNLSGIRQQRLASHIKWPSWDSWYAQRRRPGPPSDTRHSRDNVGLHLPARYAPWWELCVTSTHIPLAGASQSKIVYSATCREGELQTLVECCTLCVAGETDRTLCSLARAALGQSKGQGLPPDQNHILDKVSSFLFSLLSFLSFHFLNGNKTHRGFTF